MTLAEKYLSNLNAVRVSTSLLNSLKVVDDKDQAELNRLDRLRIATALFHHLKVGDYGLIKFLFKEELKSIKQSKSDIHRLYNINLIGLLLSRYNNMEDVWLYFEAHQLDKRFDIEFTLSTGVESVYNYLEHQSHTFKPALLRKIGRTIQTSKYKQHDINCWKEEQESFFEEFCSLGDEIHFAYLMSEVHVVKKLLPQWVKDQTWRSENLLRYVGYARILNDAEYEINALELYLSHQNRITQPSFLFDLATLYAATGKGERAVECFAKLLSITSQDKIVNASLRGLCKLVREAADHEEHTVKMAYALIQEHKRKMKDMSESVSKSIDKVAKLVASAEDSRL